MEQTTYRLSCVFISTAWKSWSQTTQQQKRKKLYIHTFAKWNDRNKMEYLKPYTGI